MKNYVDSNDLCSVRYVIEVFCCQTSNVCNINAWVKSLVT